MQRAGVTLLEMLISMIASSVLLLGAASLYQTSMINYNVMRDVRENLYSETMTSDRITDTLRKCISSEIAVRTGIGGNSAIVYRYVASRFRRGQINWLGVTRNGCFRYSGIIYAANEKLYLYENPVGFDNTAPYLGQTFTPIPEGPPVDFLSYSDAQVQAWIGTPVANPNTLRASEIVATGVYTATTPISGLNPFRANMTSNFFTTGGPFAPPSSQPLTRAVTWTVTYLPGGR